MVPRAPRREQVVRKSSPPGPAAPWCWLAPEEKGKGSLSDPFRLSSAG